MVSTASGSRLPPRGGFTLIELLVVMGIIVLLAGILLPVGRMVLNNMSRAHAQAMVNGLAAAIESYPRQTWSVSTETAGGDLREVSYPFLWDLNQERPDGRPGDGLLDGDPAVTPDATHDGPFWEPLLDSGYRGIVMVQPELRNEGGVNAKGQPIDPWGRPLRVAFSPGNNGAHRYHIWSVGPDGIDQQGAGDDISSKED